MKAAVDTTIEATGSVAVASYDWPHSPSDPVAERTITYRNTGAKDVTLDLATDTDADAYTLSAKQLTVPAASTAEAVLSLDPSKVANNTRFSGQVVAKDAAGTTVAHTGFALNKEQELYDLKLQLRDRGGRPMDGVVVLGALGDPQLMPVQVSGETTLRLPPGNYTAWTAADIMRRPRGLQGPRLPRGPRDHPGQAVHGHPRRLRGPQGERADAQGDRDPAAAL